MSLYSKYFANIDELILNNFTIADIEKYITDGPWYMQPRIYTELESLYLSLFTQMITLDCETGLDYLEQCNDDFKRIRNRLTMIQPSITNFIRCCELSHRQLSKADSNFITCNWLSKAILDDGFCHDWNHVKHLASFNEKNPIYLNIRKMYELLSQKDLLPYPHSMYVNYALCLNL